MWSQFPNIKPPAGFSSLKGIWSEECLGWALSSARTLCISSYKGQSRLLYLPGQVQSTWHLVGRSCLFLEVLNWRFRSVSWPTEGNCRFPLRSFKDFFVWISVRGSLFIRLHQFPRLYIDFGQYYCPITQNMACSSWTLQKYTSPAEDWLNSFCGGGGVFGFPITLTASRSLGLEGFLENQFY